MHWTPIFGQVPARAAVAAAVARQIAALPPYERLSLSSSALGSSLIYGAKPFVIAADELGENFYQEVYLYRGQANSLRTFDSIWFYLENTDNLVWYLVICGLRRVTGGLVVKLCNFAILYWSFWSIWIILRGIFSIVNVGGNILELILNQAFRVASYCLPPAVLSRCLLKACDELFINNNSGALPGLLDLLHLEIVFILETRTCFSFTIFMELASCELFKCSVNRGLIPYGTCLKIFQGNQMIWVNCILTPRYTCDLPDLPQLFKISWFERSNAFLLAPF